MRAAIYTRVSLDARGDARSVQEQEAECRRWVEQEGWTLDGVWCDNDISASRYGRKQRPGWRALVDRLEQGGVDVLVVWEPSRATRDRQVWAMLAATCQEQGVKFGYGGRVYDVEDADDAFQLDLFFALASRESATTSKRLRRSTRAQAAKGMPHGKLLFGYRREYDPQSGRLTAQVVDEPKADIVREAARRVLAGETTYQIAKDFNTRGIRSPRGASWSLAQVKRTLLNPAYNAQRVYQGQVVGPADWPAILDDATYAQLVAHLRDPARGGRRDSAVKHLLSGVAVCGLCGGTMRVLKNRTYLAYGCKDCWGVIRAKDPLDRIVARTVVARMSQPDAHDLLHDPQDPRVVDAVRVLEEKRARLRTFEAEAADGSISAGAFGRIESRLLADIAALEGQTRSRTAPPALAQLVNATEPEAAWAALPVAQARELVNYLLTVRIHPTRRGARTVDIDSIEFNWRV